jgi:tRNA pseudouridine38-40 synthase
LRYAAGVEYDGGAYSGWQVLDGVPSVQVQVERALSQVAAEPIKVVCAGRTDAGVHALCQVIHFDTAAVRPGRGWVLGANTYLPSDISVLWARAVPEDFHARFSATARRYRYVLFDRRTRSGLWSKRSSWSAHPLDASAMHAAAQCLVGRHDFTSFRASECQASSPIRLVESLTVQREGALVVLEVQANAFLHHMVRNIVGTLLPVGRGERPGSWVAEVLAACDRRVAGITAPPHGLYFAGVRYPAALDVPPTREWTESAVPALDDDGTAGPAAPSVIMTSAVPPGG